MKKFSSWKLFIGSLISATSIVGVVSCSNNKNPNIEGNPIILKSLNKKIADGTFKMGDIFEALTKAFKIGETYKSKFSTSFKQSNNISSVFFQNLTSISKKIIEEKWSNHHYAYSPYLRTDLVNRTHPDFKADMGAIMKDYSFMNLSFIQSKKSSKIAKATWNGVLEFDANASSKSYEWMTKAINSIRRNNGQISFAFGGASGTGLWEHRDPILMAKQLEIIVKAFKIKRLDYDIEMHSLTNNISWEFALATSIVQKKLASEGKTLEVMLTLPTPGSTLTSSALNNGNVEKVIKNFIKAGVSLKYINFMTMMIDKTWVNSKGGQVGAQTWLASTLPGYIKNIYGKLGKIITKEEAAFITGITINVGVDTWLPEKLKTQDIKLLYNAIKDAKIGFFSHWTMNMDNPKLHDQGKPTFTKGELLKYFKNYSKDLKDANLFKKYRHGISVEKYNNNSNVISEIKKLYQKLIGTNGDFISTVSLEETGVIIS